MEHFETISTQLIDHAILGRQEIIDLVYRARRGDEAARERVVLTHWRMIRKVAWKCERFAGSHDIDDLAHFGVIGLLRAIDLYDPKHGLAFSTYAMVAVRSHILRGIQQGSRMIRIPNYFQYDSADRRKSKRLQDIPQEPLSLQEPVKRGKDEREIGSLLADHRNPSREFIENRAAIETALAELSPLYRKILRWRYYEGLEQPEIGKKLGGLTHQRISQIEKSALRQMREQMTGISANA